MFSGWEDALLTRVIILVVAFLVWIVWYFSFAYKGQGLGGQCTQNSDCTGGLYCGGNFQCNQGQATQPGGACVSNGQCQVGLVCNNGICDPSFNPDRTPINSFSNSYLIINIDNIPYYLTITNNNSVFSPQQPSETFTYNASNKSLLYGGCQVGINTSGYLTLAQVTSVEMFITNNNGILLSDLFANDLLRSVALESGSNNYLAFFFDVQRYPNAPDLSRMVAELALLPST